MNFLRKLGIGLLVIGVLLALASLTLPTTVPLNAPPIDDALAGLRAAPPEVANLSLLQRQMLLFVAGWSIAIIGAVFMGADIVGQRTNQRLQDAGHTADTAPGRSTLSAEQHRQEAAAPDPRDRVVAWFAVAALVTTLVTIAIIYTAPSARPKPISSGSIDNLIE